MQRRWHFLKIFLIVTGMIGVFIIIAVLGKREKEDKDSLYSQKESENAPEFAVTVQAKEYSGQGVVYKVQNNTVYVLTAAHLTVGMEIGENCTVTFYDGEKKDAVLIYRSDTTDSAFLMLEGREGRGGVPVDRSRFDSLTEKDRVSACYFAEGVWTKLQGEILYPWIYIEDFTLDMMLVKMDVTAGMSGCAVLDEKGCFIGIICGVNEEGEAAVLPLSVIESEWMMTGR